MVGTQHHGLVAGDVGLRAEHVQALRAGGTRRGLQGEGGNATGSHARDGLVAERVEHANQYRAGLHQRQFGVVRGHDLEHQIGTKHGSGIANIGADDFINVVGQAGFHAGTALHSHLMALGNQLLDGFGSCGNARLPGVGLERNTDVH